MICICFLTSVGKRENGDSVEIKGVNMDESMIWYFWFIAVFVVVVSFLPGKWFRDLSPWIFLGAAGATFVVAYIFTLNVGFEFEYVAAISLTAQCPALAGFVKAMAHN